jgi:two-component system sensor histidine kinase CpxA
MFVKIFLSFWLTVGLFAAAQEIAARISRNEEQRTIASARATVNDALPIASAYEQRGSDGAKAAVDAFQRRHKLFADVLDARRISLTGRAVTPAETVLARQADRVAAAGLPNGAFNPSDALAAQQVVTSRGERLTIVVGLPLSATTVVSRALLFSWQIRMAVILAIGGLVCLVVARHLTRPIVNLSTAAKALAAGDLQTRLGAAAGSRRDELGTLARDFDQMAARIEALVAGQRRLLGDVSHELRSPLARLTVALSLAQQNPAAAEYWSRIKGEAGRLDRLIEQLLTLARIETGVEGHRERFDLTEIVQEVVSDGDFEARAHGRRVTLAECEAAPLNGMPELMRSAIENVVRNAIRHTAPESSVEIGLRVDHGTARVSVRDHGPGVDDALLSDIFGPFWRGPCVDTSDGAGLGLAITDRVVRMHQGRVWATNAGTGGLIVTIDVPLPPTSASTHHR